MTSSVQSPVPAVPRAAGTGPAPVELTPRERVALTAVAMGLTQTAAARRLGTSDRTFRRALASALERLGARSPAHAVALAAVAGQVDLERVRDRRLPAWPPDPQRAPVRVSRNEQVTARRVMFARLRAEGQPVREAGWAVGVGPATARRYERARQEVPAG